MHTKHRKRKTKTLPKKPFSIYPTPSNSLLNQYIEMLFLNSVNKGLLTNTRYAIATVSCVTGASEASRVISTRCIAITVVIVNIALIFV